MSTLSTTLAASFAGKRVLVTGHTGFKGSWLTLWLGRLGAHVTGYALAPDGPNSVFEVLGLSERCTHVEADVRDSARLAAVVQEVDPDFVFHLAAQPLVRRSYAEPVYTWEVNVVGTANVLDAVRRRSRPCAVVVVTTDKCYENREWVYSYREEDALGGHDPYSASKAGTELVATSYRRSFFPPHHLAAHGIALATARAGNVIGGGDWAKDRIVPDAVASLGAGRPIPVRNPASVRPWQHVLEPLSGYLILAHKLATGAAEERARFCEAWNFGPGAESMRSVRDLVEELLACWGEGAWHDHSDPRAVHESKLLRLSIDKSESLLGWRPRWSFGEGVARTVEWYRAFFDGVRNDMLATSLAQIDAYVAAERP